MALDTPIESRFLNQAYPNHANMYATNAQSFNSSDAVAPWYDSPQPFSTATTFRGQLHNIDSNPSFWQTDNGSSDNSNGNTTPSTSRTGNNSGATTVTLQDPDINDFIRPANDIDNYYTEDVHTEEPYFENNRVIVETLDDSYVETLDDSYETGRQYYDEDIHLEEEEDLDTTEPFVEPIIHEKFTVDDLNTYETNNIYECTNSLYQRNRNCEWLENDSSIKPNQYYPVDLNPIPYNDKPVAVDYNDREDTGNNSMHPWLNPPSPRISAETDDEYSAAHERPGQKRAPHHPGYDSTGYIQETKRPLRAFRTEIPLEYSAILREQNESKFTLSLYVIACFIYFVDL